MLLTPIFTGARLDGERSFWHVNTELFLLFTYVIRLKTDVQACLGQERIHAVLNLTRSVFCCSWASCETDTNARTNLIWCAIGFNHDVPCYVKNMARGTQVDKNRGRRQKLRPEGHVFNIAWQAMIKTYYSIPLLWFKQSFSIRI